MRKLWWLGLIALIGVVGLVPVSPAGAAVPRIDLKVLLLSSGADTSTQLSAWQQSLDSIGVPYDTFVRSDTSPVTPDLLVAADGHGRYNGIIVTDGHIMSNWSGAPASEKAVIAAYERDFSVREIADNGGPDPGFGLDYAAEGSPAGLGSATLTASGRQVFPYLNPNIVVPYESGLWMYLAVPYDHLPTWNGWGLTDVTSVETLVGGPVLPGVWFQTPPTQTMIVGIAHHSDGREQMVTTVNSSWWTTSDKLLHVGMLSWVTRGLFLGSWHNYLSLHFDDVLLSDARWSVDRDCTPGVDTTCAGAAGLPIRMTPSDVTRAVQWSALNGIRLDLVFNGQGATPNEGNGVRKGQADGLTAALLGAKSRFGWISHTWSHQDFDTANLTTIVNEIKKNQTWASTNKVPTAASELVTGGHTGLSNPVMPTALSRTGITAIAGDASVNPDVRMLGPATVVPRYPSPLFYNVGTRAEQLDEFNYLYRDDPYVNAPVTWAQYVDIGASNMLHYVLANDPRPFFSHQNNLAEDGTFYDVANELLARYRAWFQVPPAQPTMTEAGAILTRQAAWAKALHDGSVTAYVQGGVVHIQSTVAVTVPITGTQVGNVYGGMRGGWVAVTPTTPATIAGA